MAGKVVSALITVAIFWFYFGRDAKQMIDYEIQSEELSAIIDNADALKSAEIPSQLLYLKPLVDKLAPVAADDVDFSDDPALISLAKKTISDRVKGLGKDEAKKKILEDFKILCAWGKNEEVLDTNVYMIENFFYDLLMYESIEEGVKDIDDTTFI